MQFRHERRQVLHACRDLQRHGLVVGTAGNVSVRVEDAVVISPSGVPYEEVDEHMVCVLDLQGRVVEGGWTPSSEWPLHTAIYRATEAGAVVHTHAPASTAMGMLVDVLPASHYYCALFGGPIRVAPYAPFGSAELADHVVEALQGRRGALMANHGATMTGDSLPDALSLPPYLEYLCEVHLRALATGLPLKTLTSEDIAEVMTRLVGYGQRQHAGNPEGDPADNE